MIRINNALTPKALAPKINRLWEASASKILSIEQSCPPGKGAPVFTVRGRYTARGWTEWTRGFQYGSAILQFDATGDGRFLAIGRDRTVETMASHVTHIGVHDHGFNNFSTYGNLWRLMNEGRIEENRRERDFYELAIKCSGAVQAARWSATSDGGGYICSFNGPQSLFVDTLRTLRSLALAHALGHALMGEQDARISLLGRLIEHAAATARWNIYYGTGRDVYDTPDARGRTAHESVFNPRNGVYRCPSSQQGYSPFSTWTRGLAWAMLGFAEELEFLESIQAGEFGPFGGRSKITAMFLKAAMATCDFYIQHACPDGIPYWDTRAPGLAKLKNHLDKPADPYNEFEPVDSSAAVIAAQGLLRLGRYLKTRGRLYVQAGLTVADTLFDEPYLSTNPKHQGLILHSVYHRPNGWDHVASGQKIPNGESSMWGDYHARELAVGIQRLAEGGPYHAFFGPR